MKFPITYNSKSMTLHIEIGKYYKYLQCPFATWWKARKYFKRPRFKFYFGPMWKYKGKVQTEFGEYDDYEYKGGYWPCASTNYLKWYTPKWFPIHVMSWDIGWKDKYDSPRYERPGYFIIFFGKDYHKHWQFSMVVTAPKFYCNNDCTIEDFDDNYWESILWYSEYPDKYNDMPDQKNDLIKARNSMQDHHISRTNVIDLDDAEILNVGQETISLGNEEKYKLTYFNVRSDKLINIIENSHKYPSNKLMSNLDVYIDMICPKEEGSNMNRDLYQCCAYTWMYSRSAVRLYFWDDYDMENEDKFKLFNRYNEGDYTDIRFSFSERVDLGPTFKDDFLNKNGIKKIQEYYKKNEDSIS